MNFKVQTRGSGEFIEKQLWLKANEYEEGIKFVIENSIKSLFLQNDQTEKYYTLDFSWLSELQDIETLEFALPLTKESNIEGIYKLGKLKKLSYHMNYDTVPLNHERLRSLEYLYTNYSKNHKKNGKLL